MQTSFYGVLQSKFGDNCGHRRFDDMAHGFAGARGNYSDPIIRERVDEVITTLGVFFDRNLNEYSDLLDIVDRKKNSKISLFTELKQTRQQTYSLTVFFS